MKTITPNEDETHLHEAAKVFLKATRRAALTGAGISVESGIPDFRSPGGLWTTFPPEEYATINAFIQTPEKAWRLFRALGKTLEGKTPNPAHHALARMETSGLLDGVITQNVDHLHQAAGADNVIEIHGDHQHLQCIRCQWIGEVSKEVLLDDKVPLCPQCEHPLKPNVVLFGEGVRSMDRILGLLENCEVLCVVGTSAQVHPAAGLPQMVKDNNGLIFEFNVEETNLTLGHAYGGVRTDYFFKGSAGVTTPRFADAVLNKSP